MFRSGGFLREYLGLIYVIVITVTAFALGLLLYAENHLTSRLKADLARKSEVAVQTCRPDPKMHEEHEELEARRQAMLQISRLAQTALKGD